MKNTLRTPQAAVLGLALAGLLPTLSGATALERPIPKQLAGPPAEFSLMVPAAPAVVSSDSAMVPVTLTPGPDGTLQWHGEFIADGSEGFRMLMLSGGESWDVQLEEPVTGRILALSDLRPEVVASTIGAYTGDLATFHQGIEAGTWGLKVSMPATGDAEVHRGFVVVGGDSPYLLESRLTTRDLRLGEEIGFLASAGLAADPAGEGITGTSASLSTTEGAPALTRGTLLLTKPSGVQVELPLAAAGDGLFGASFRADEIGNYTAQVTAVGETPEGQAFLRSTQHTFPVLPSGLAVADSAAVATSQGRWAVRLSLSSEQGLAERYHAYGEVWGRSAGGEAVPVAWIGGITEVKDGGIDLGLDTRWIQRAKAGAPFELRNLRIQDVDTFVPLFETARLDLPSPGLSVMTQRLGSREITSEMRLGPRPAELSNLTAPAGTGSRLLLVHGYCSGDVWGPVAGQFTNASRFQDLNANRSHDAFAQRIWTFGNTWFSYGIVAHSQGGAASLHLYTYYWSGLDNASGPRLIQSVGTPYQGTSLAGNLAILGQIFGAGCGTNYDLTYDGASAWLSNIPTWARNQVWYHTTSFTDRWWAYDYCNLATDLFLSDPEDGVVEKSKGQLSSGHNLGHKTGWCHTDGMRDPSQVRDSSRNSNMNANAAR